MSAGWSSKGTEERFKNRMLSPSRVNASAPTDYLVSPTQHKASFKVTMHARICNVIEYAIEYAIIHKTNSLDMGKETFK